MNDAQQPQRAILYFADPMCTWCWGFAPVSRELADAGAAGVNGKCAPLRVVAGGLTAGRNIPLHETEARGMVAEWRKVNEATSQPFAFDNPIDNTTVYNSGPACRALALMGRLHPTQALSYLHELQKAFFVERHNLSETQVLVDCAQYVSVDAKVFSDTLAKPQAEEAFQQDLRLSHDLGQRSFPSVALQNGDNYALLTVGYRPWAALAPNVRRWLEQL